jgi:hypothetical protein
MANERTLRFLNDRSIGSERYRVGAVVSVPDFWATLVINEGSAVEVEEEPGRMLGAGEPSEPKADDAPKAKGKKKNG